VFQDFNAHGTGRYSAGGYGRVAEVCAEYVASCPGCGVRYRTRAKRILVEDGAVTGVATEAGTFRAPIVISNAGIQPTVLKLVGPEHFDLGYVNYIRGLIPSWGLMGIRYFVNKPVFRYPMGIAYSDDSYWTVDRFAAAQRGEVPDEVLLFLVIPSLFDPSLAPPGKQCVLASTLCSPDPHMDPEPWWRKVDEMVEKLWPEMKGAVESKEPYSTQHVSVATRDSAVAGAGGECIGLGQIVGQCGKYKPSAQAPVRGLFYVGCDAGGYGCGTHQAADSGVKVAELAHRYHRQRLAFR